MNVEQVWGKQHPNEKDAIPWVYRYDNDTLYYGRPGGYHYDCFLAAGEHLMSGGMAEKASTPMVAGFYFPKSDQARMVSGEGSNLLPPVTEVPSVLRPILSDPHHISKIAIRELQHSDLSGEFNGVGYDEDDEERYHDESQPFIALPDKLFLGEPGEYHQDLIHRNPELLQRDDVMNGTWGRHFPLLGGAFFFDNGGHRETLSHRQVLDMIENHHRQASYHPGRLARKPW